jgi:hypothetical protein
MANVLRILFDERAHAAQTFGPVDEGYDLEYLLEQFLLRRFGVVGHAWQLL